MRAVHVLDNPIWHALVTGHARLAEGGELARRYPPAVSPLAAMREPSAEGYDALARLLGPGGMAAIFLDAPPMLPAAGWTLVRAALLAQMVCTAPVPAPHTAAVTRLGPADLPAMMALTAKTEPGPFGPRTPELGTYLGIHDSGCLAAMAGERLRLGEYLEVSAVCTEPEFRGRGYAAALISTLVAAMTARGEIPILHVRADNATAIRVYERLGFTTRRTLHLAIVKVAPSAA